MTRWTVVALLSLLLVVPPVQRPVWAQQAPAPTEAPPSPASPVPSLPPPGSLVTPPAPPSPPSPSPTVPAPPAAPADQAILPGIDGPVEVMVAARPVLILKGQSTWDDGYETLMESFLKLQREAERLKLPLSGRPQAVFTSTDDNGFRFEAQLALSSDPPAPSPVLTRGFELGKSPEGKALKFVHNGAYDDIDTTYEAITAYLDEKGLKARNLFIEEYTNDTKGSDDGTLKMNIFILIE